MSFEAIAQQLGLQCDGYNIYGFRRGHAVRSEIQRRFGQYGRDGRYQPSLFSVGARATFSPSFDLSLSMTLVPGRPPMGFFDNPRVQALLADGRGEQLGTLSPGASLRVDDHSLVVDTQEVGDVEGFLLWALDKVSRDAQLLHAARTLVPPRAELAALVPRVQSFAESRELTFLPCPLGMVGSVEETWIELVSRTPPRDTFVLFVGYPVPLGFHLVLRPQSLVADITSIFEFVEDVSVGDGAIDHAFVVRVDNLELFRGRLPGLRDILLDLRHRGDLIVDSSGVRFEARDLEVVLSALDPAVDLAKKLAGVVEPSGTTSAFR